MVKPSNPKPTKRPSTIVEDDDLEDEIIEEATRFASSLGDENSKSNQAAPSAPHPSSDIPTSSPTKKKSSYGAYLKRKAAGPTAPGSKEIPQGVPNCLVGLTLVFTGELSSIGRDEATDLVKGLGGRVTGAPSRKTDFVIVGEAAGESKLAKVKELGLKSLDEDGLFELIRSKSASAEPAIETTESPKKKQKQSPKKVKTESPKKARIEKVESLPAVGDALWTLKYAPKSEADLIGNRSIYEKLMAWLALEKPDPKAALLSGPPGIGKTTMAHLAANTCGFRILEFNASDCRNKKALQDSVREVIDNTALSTDFFSKPKSKDSKAKLQRQVIIMDEVDGMSAGDRGGMAELIQLIKQTRIPIICCCNDRSSPKVRSLANHCLDLRLRRPDARQVQVRMQEICAKENLKLQPNVIEELVASTHGDIRQLLNCLSTYRLSGAQVLSHGKDVEEGPFDAVYKLLGGQYDKMGMSQRLDSYFVDSSLIPLMIHENYLRAKANNKRATISSPSANYMDLTSMAADAISASHKVESLIRGSNQEWSLAPLHGFLSCVYPSYFVHGSISEQVAFPSWFGQNSKSTKCARLLRELSQHTFLALQANSSDLRQYYLEWLASSLLEPLQAGEVEKAIEFMESMHLCREDVDSLLELTGMEPTWSKIPSNVKSAFTRKYNSSIHRLPYAQGVATGRAIKVQDLDTGIEEDADGEAPVEEEDTESISTDKMIKEKKPSGRGKKK